jgi:hypothetical protein
MSYAPITRNGVESAEPLEFPAKRLSISTIVQYRGRTFTVTAEGYTVDRLCDMLDEKFGPVSAAPVREEHPARPAWITPVGLARTLHSPGAVLSVAAPTHTKGTDHDTRSSHRCRTPL